MILNPFKCEGCGEELQPEDIKVGFDNDNLIRLCVFCGHEVKIKGELTSKQEDLILARGEE